jgi:hypothetical protein
MRMFFFLLSQIVLGHLVLIFDEGTISIFICLNESTVVLSLAFLDLKNKYIFRYPNWMNEQLCLKHIWVPILVTRSKMMNGYNSQKKPISEFFILCNKKKYYIYLCRYSGADISVVCREALIIPIRPLSTATHFKRVSILVNYSPVILL